MNAKKEYLVLFLIIVGAGLYLYFNRADEMNYRLPALAVVDRTDIARIKIERPGQDTLTLEKKEGHWRILPAGYAADTDTVAEILTAVTDLTLTTLVSESENYQRYGLDPGQALVVSALGADGSVLRRFQTGKSAASQGHTFVMTAEDARVYQARGRLRRIFDKTADDLRDKTVLAFIAEDIKSIDVSADGMRLALVKQAVSEKAETGADGDMVWIEASGRSPADQAAVTSLLNSLASLECRSFITAVDRETLPEPIYTVTLTGEQSYGLSLFPPEDQEGADYRGISTQQTDAFVLPSYTAEPLMKGPDELMGEREDG